MLKSEKNFYRTLAAGLLLCAGLYAEEMLHFIHFGYQNPENDTWTRDVTACKPVPGRDTDIECPVRGYGWYRYRYVDHKYPNRNDMVPVDRIQ